MKYTFWIVVGSGLAFGQNPNSSLWPPTTASDTTLLVASNNAQFALSSTINNVVTTIPLNSAGGLLAPVAITIDSEIMLCPTLSGTNLTGCTRGWRNTTATTHTAGAKVFGFLIDWHHNQLAAEIKAIENNAAIGPATNTDQNIPQWSGTNSRRLANGLGFVTTLGNPGLNTNIASEAAVRSAIASSGGGTLASLTLAAPLVGSSNPITTTGTISCPTCTANIAPFVTNQLVISAGAQATQTLGSFGTIHQYFHGNAAGVGGFSAIDLTADVTNSLPFASLSVTSANVVSLFTGTCDSTHALFGDGTCKTAGSGSGNVTGPGSSTNGFIPQWSGASGAALGTGLPVSATAAASTIVESGGGGTIAAAWVPQLTATQMPAFTGDLSSSAGSVSMTFNTVNSGSGTCGDSTHVCQITDNAKGLVTSQTAVGINFGAASNPFQFTRTSNTVVTITAIGVVDCGPLPVTLNITGTITLSGNGSATTFYPYYDCNAGAIVVPTSGANFTNVTLGSLTSGATGATGVTVLNNTYPIVNITAGNTSSSPWQFDTSPFTAQNGAFQIPWFDAGSGLLKSINASTGDTTFSANTGTTSGAVLSKDSAMAGVCYAPALTSSGTTVYASSFSTNCKALTTYTTGQTLLFKPDVTCTSSCTWNINTLGAIAIKQLDGSTDPLGTLVGGVPYWLYYDGTVFRMLPGENLTSAVNANFTYTQNGANTVVTVIASGVFGCGTLPVALNTTGTITLSSGGAPSGTQFWLYFDCSSQSMILNNKNSAFTGVALSGITQGSTSATGFTVSNNVYPIVLITAGNNTVDKFDLAPFTNARSVVVQPTFAFNSGLTSSINGSSGLTTVTLGNTFGMTTVTFSSTPIFDCSTQAVTSVMFKITLTGNVTSSTLVNCSAGQPITFDIAQDSGGSHTFVFPTNVKTPTTIGSTASKSNVQSFLYDGTNAYAVATGVTNQ